MFVCRSCARRASTALSRRVPSTCEVPSPAAALGALRPPTASSFSMPVRRSHAPAVDTLEEDPDFEESFRDGGRTKAPGSAKESAKADKKLAWVVRKHLEHMEDPFKIAEHVKRTLEKDRFEEALELTRTASKDAQCQVSWSYLIDYQLNNQRLHAAIKLFNEVRSS